MNRIRESTSMPSSPPRPGYPGGCHSGPAQRRVIGVLRWRQPVLLLDLFRGEAGQVGDTLARVEDGHRIVDQLQRVPVTGDDEDLETLRLGLGGERGDDVVGLVAVDREHLDAERIEDFLGDVDLPVELVRRLRPLRLVLRVHLRAEGLPGDVERCGDVRRLLVAQQVDEHRGEAVHRIGVLTGLGLEVLGR